MSDAIHTNVIEKLRLLRLSHIAEALDESLSLATRKGLSNLEFLDMILSDEQSKKMARRVQMAMQIAHFPTIKTIDDFDFSFQPSIDQRLFNELSTGHFISQHENVLLFGPPGVGKTHLAISLGRCGVQHGYSVLFTSATELIAALANAEANGTLDEKVSYYSKPKLLIVDELGYLPFEKRSAHLFFQLVSRRYERGSMLITTNQAAVNWGSVFGDDVTASALLDRLLHHSHAIVIKGESYRLKNKKKLVVNLIKPE